MKRHACMLLIMAVTLASCNKDDVITAGPSGEPDTPERPQDKPAGYDVVEYTPAPGQFIGDPKAGFTGLETTADAAAAYAQKRLDNGVYLSLGAFGGYVVVKLRGSLKPSATAEYDFAVCGNMIASSNEPGVVYVMQDTNGNGQPDDEWYELRGSESISPSTVRAYSVTYSRPADGEPVSYVDSQGDRGQIERLEEYHPQPSYYPTWIAEDSYTLSGVRLESRIEQTSGVWAFGAFAWGYADNIGTDLLDAAILDRPGRWTGFKLSNAMTAEGLPIRLEAVDFIKVQSAVMAQVSPIGECSTEILGFDFL